jgi:hypothetical protein
MLHYHCHLLNINVLFVYLHCYSKQGILIYLKNKNNTPSYYTEKYIIFFILTIYIFTNICWLWQFVICCQAVFVDTRYHIMFLLGQSKLSFIPIRAPILTKAYIYYNRILFMKVTDKLVTYS